MEYDPRQHIFEISDRLLGRTHSKISCRLENVINEKILPITSNNVCHKPNQGISVGQTVDE